MDISIGTREVDGVSVVDVVGEVEVYTHHQLKTALFELVDAGRRKIVVNLAGVRYIDSTGLGVLISVYKRVREQDGRLVLAGVLPVVKKSFLITGLVKIFEFFEDDAAAVASFAPPGMLRITHGRSSVSMEYVGPGSCEAVEP